MQTEPLKKQVLFSYRNLLKTIHSVFKGDRMMKTMAVKNLRSQYEMNRSLSNPQEIVSMVEQANQAATFAKMSVVQGVKGNEGYTIQMGKENVDPFLDSEVMVSAIDERLIQREQRKQKKEENKKD